MRAEDRNPLKQDAVTTLLKGKPQHPFEDEIRKRAYDIHQAREGAPGREMDDWLQAERELKEQLGAST